MYSSYIHKETFYQPVEDGIPGIWVVFYWDDSQNPLTDAHLCKYFTWVDDALVFEGKLIKFDDWVTSQEMSLSVQ